MLESELFWSIVNKGIFFIEWALIYLLFKSISKLKTSKFIGFSTVLGATLIGIIFDAIGVHPNIKVLTLIIITLILYKINFEVSIQKCCLVVIIFWTISIGIEAITMSIIMYISGINNADIFLNNGVYRLASMIITKGMLIVLVLVVKNIELSKNNIPTYVKTSDLIHISLPIFTNIISLLIIFGYKMQTNTDVYKDNKNILLLTVLVFISNIFIILLVGKIIRENKLSLENKFIKEKMKTQYEYYERMKEKQFRTRQLYHDMKNHLACIERLNNNIDSKKYIDNMKKEIYKLENNFNTGNMILDIVLDEKSGICEEKNISFISKIDSKQIDFIEDIDVCSIYSNAIDNAIEACDKISESEKHITIASTYIKNFCIIKIENSKVNEIILKEGKIKTNKNDKLLHGIGIESIKRTVEKYDGEVVIDYSDSSFVLKIMIPLNTSEIAI
ncbi:MAG: ATP-binding protein [Peptostreptococcaceae bacterium]